MIDDLVILPSRLTTCRHRDTNVSSDVVCTLPISQIARNVGYESPNDEEWVQFGSSFEVPSGKDTWFRFKLIENTLSGLCEYFCISESPVDFIHPNRSKKVKIYCLWVSVTNRKTGFVRKYVLWRNVFDVCHYEIEDNVVDAPIESVIAAEIRAFANMYGCPELAMDVKDYPEDFGDVLISEIKHDVPDHLEQLNALYSNMRAVRELTSSGCPECDITDIYRGLDLPQIWSDFTPLHGASVLQLVQFGPVLMGDLMFLIGSSFNLHRFHRSFLERPLDPMTVLDIPTDDKCGLFTIIKYVESLPYSEFKLRITRNGLCDFTLYNQSGRVLNIDKSADHKLVINAVMENLKKVIREGFPSAMEVTVARSWTEEIYITVLNNDRTIDRYYYDMSVASLCSRDLIRDYSGPSFFIG